MNYSLNWNYYFLYDAHCTDNSDKNITKTELRGNTQNLSFMTKEMVGHFLRLIYFYRYYRFHFFLISSFFIEKQGNGNYLFGKFYLPHQPTLGSTCSCSVNVHKFQKPTKTFIP